MWADGWARQMVGTRQRLELVWMMDGWMDGATTGLQKQAGLALGEIDVSKVRCGKAKILRHSLVDWQEKHTDSPVFANRRRKEG